MANISDVAKAAKVSKTTVSRYLNDKSRVGKKTAAVIEKVIDELNYIPSATARNLALGQQDTIGVLISGVTSIFWNQVHSAIHKKVSQSTQHYEVLTLNCDNDILNNTDKSVNDKLRTLIEQRVAGIILALRDAEQIDVDYICAQDVPFVVIQYDSTFDDSRISYVNIDNYKAAYDACEYIQKLGHKKIAYVTGPHDAAHSNLRYEGFSDSLKNNKLYNRNMVLHGNNHTSDGYWRMKQILSWSDRPTAVMFSCDAMAYGAMAVLRENNIFVPEDISIMGFDGLAEEVEMFSMLPPLTTILQPMGLIGEKSAEIILSKIKDKAEGTNKQYRVTLPTTFLDRGSCRNIG